MIVRVFISITLAAVGVVGGVLGLWIADRTAPATTLTARVINDPVAAGDDARIQYRVVRHRSCEYTVDRYLYDADNVRVVLDDLLFLAAPGPLGDQTYIAPIPIPRNFAVGLARYRTSFAYRCNPVHRLWPILVEGLEIQFNVKRP